MIIGIVRLAPGRLMTALVTMTCSSLIIAPWSAQVHGSEEDAAASRSRKGLDSGLSKGCDWPKPDWVLSYVVCS
jgi:hypothetical protein